MSTVKMPNMDQRRAEVTQETTQAIQQTGSTLQQGGDFLGSAVEAVFDNPVLGQQIKEVSQVAGQVVQTSGQIYNATQTSDGSLQSVVGTITDAGKATLDVANQFSGDSAFTAQGQTKIYQGRIEEEEKKIEGLQMELESARNERHEARVKEKIAKSQAEIDLYQEKLGQ